MSLSSGLVYVHIVLIVLCGVFLVASLTTRLTANIFDLPGKALIGQMLIAFGASLHDSNHTS